MSIHGDKTQLERDHVLQGMFQKHLRSFSFFLTPAMFLCLCFETLQFKFYLLNWLSCALQSSCFTVTNIGVVNKNEL